MILPSIPKHKESTHRERVTESITQFLRRKNYALNDQNMTEIEQESEVGKSQNSYTFNENSEHNTSVIYLRNKQNKISKRKKKSIQEKEIKNNDNKNNNRIYFNLYKAGVVTSFRTNSSYEINKECLGYNYNNNDSGFISSILDSSIRKKVESSQAE